ncbi:hypothetical protein NDU88_004350 [Pleurodeles waltl]|uniref:Uncharacterized protein n=1 Tax=Pleurodeles waltl TaxID=8319 RepID=A0AAV7L4G6_PLEWA|nr:hypothetical protein NDU88_004350 [Pleurodeles waltl]
MERCGLRGERRSWQGVASSPGDLPAVIVHCVVLRGPVYGCVWPGLEGTAAGLGVPPHALGSMVEWHGTEQERCRTLGVQALPREGRPTLIAKNVASQQTC